jgi:hypothetical protein
MGNNPYLSPPVIRTREDRDLAVLRQVYLDGKLTTEEFEDGVGRIMRGECVGSVLAPPPGGLPPVAKARASAP